MFFNKQPLNNEQNFKDGCDMNVVLNKSMRINYFFKVKSVTEYSLWWITAVNSIT